jgi:hypothetical protein
MLGDVAASVLPCWQWQVGVLKRNAFVVPTQAPNSYLHLLEIAGGGIRGGYTKRSLSCVSTVVQIHSAARASSSGEQLGEQKICLAPLASELHVTYKSGKRRAARWICTTVETRL